METIALFLLWYPVFLFSTTLHEAAHAYAAKLGGDLTAYRSGQVSINPLPHIRREVFGTVIVPIASFFFGHWMFGWASTPYDPQWAERNPKKAAWMSLAGPAANLALVIAAGLLIRISIWIGVLAQPQKVSFTEIAIATDAGLWSGVAVLLSVTFSLNLILMAFNLLPLPPLDGSGILPVILPQAATKRLREFLHQPMFFFIAMVVAWIAIGPVLYPMQRVALNLLYPGAGYH
jgi:Zn-dependent protease